MKQALIKIANFLRLLDENGLLSLTNIAVIVMLGKIALNQSCDVGSFGALLTVLSGYHFKKYIKSKEPKVSPIDQVTNDIAIVKSELNSIKMKMGLNERRIG